MTKRQGRPKSIPKRVTVTLAQHHADELQRLADEAGVTLSALCAHVLERYAIQDRVLMTNDVLAEKLTIITEKAAQDFAARFGDVLLRTAHETVAMRRQLMALTAVDQGQEAADQLKESTWQAAVKTLRPYTQRVRGQDEGESAGS